MYLDEQAPQDAFGVSNSNNIFWKLSGGNLLPSLATWGVRVPSLPSEDCVGTDATGLLQAGTCTGGSGGGGTTTIDYDGVDQGTFEVLDFTLTDFVITESPSTDFDIAIHADIARDTELYTDAKVSTYLTTGVGLTEVGGLIDWDTGYAAVLTASSTNWNDFFDTPSSVITAGTDISWTGNTLNVTAHTVDTSAATICSGTGNYLDGEGNCDALVTNTDTQLTNEQVEDFVGAMLGGTETLIAVTYQDGTGDIDFVVDEASLSLTESQISDLTHTTDTNLSEEEVEDFVGGMLGGTETLISVTYVDGTNDIDFVVDEASIDHDALTNFTADEHFLQSAISITESQISDLSHLATSITDGLIIEPDLNTDNAAVDGDILVYDSTGTNFTWMTCAEITGSADLCDGSDATGSGGDGLATSTPIADTEIIWGTSASAVGSEAAFTYDDSTNIMTVGSIGIGTAAPFSKLHVIGTTTIHAGTDDTALRLFENAGGEYMDISLETGGNIIFNADDGQSPFTIFGGVGVGGERFIHVNNAGVTDSNTSIGFPFDDQLDLYAGGILFASFVEDTTDTATTLGDLWDFTGVATTTFAHASTTKFTFGGVTGTSWTDFCVAITGSADLCDGSDDGSGGGGGDGLATSTAIADEYMIYGTAAGTVGGEAAFTYDDATNILTVGSIANHIIGTDIQGILTNEAGLYAALSDVTDFLQSTDALNGELITDNTIDEDSIDWGTGTDQVSLLDLGLAATHDTASELDALYEGELTNEAGLYAALSDVTDFLQASDQNAGTDITADLEEEVTVGSLADGVINEPDLHTDNTAVDGDILVYDSTGTNFIWQTCAEITGSADLCDGNDATGGGGGSGLFASTTGDGGVEVSYLVNTASDLTLGASATSTAPFWFDVSAAVANIGTGGSGDSVIEMAVNSATKWSLGVDDSATNDPFVVSLGSVLGTTNALSINGSTRDTTISTGLVVTDDITLGGDVINEFAGTGLTVSGNALTADLGTDIIATELDADVVATDGDFLQYDSTGTNFTWRSATELVADIEAAMESALDSLLSLVSVAISTTLQIPFGATCDSATDGELCHDNTDDQLILAGAVVGKTTEKIWSTTFASTSAAFIAGGLLPVPVDLDGYTMTAIRCKVDGGTSKTLAVEDASANTTEDIVCAGTVTSDDGSITNAGVTAAEEMYIDFGATSGSVNYVTVSVFGTWTRE